MVVGVHGGRMLRREIGAGSWVNPRGREDVWRGIVLLGWVAETKPTGDARLAQDRARQISQLP